MMSNAKNTQAEHKEPAPVPASALSYRPHDYFGRHDEQISLMTRVKGTLRRKVLLHALETGQFDTVPNDIKSAGLSTEDRQFIGRLHPSFMGGEYLPTANTSEIEVARISIRSTTGDVVSVYARLVGRRIAYRVVDEYQGDTLSDRTTRTSTKPLTLGQLIDFFMGAWSLFDCLSWNFEDDLDGMLNFFTAESAFYPCLDDTLRNLVRQRFMPENEGDEGEEADG